MNVTIVGNVNYDIITTPDGKTRSGYGGILYNTMVLQALLPPPSEITPVAPLGRENLADLRRLLDSSTAVSLYGFYHHPPGINRCYLEYQSPDRRLERLQKNTNPIPFSRIEPFIDCDMIIVNFISGYDVTLKTMNRIGLESSGLVVMDIQSMSLGLQDGIRKVRPIPRLHQWAACADLIHLSLEDLQAHFGQDITDLPKASLELSRAILDNGRTTLVMVSFGTDGSYVHGRRAERIYQCFVPAYPAAVVDTTGCGDAYTTAFACHYALYMDSETAGHYAAGVAARIAELPDLESIPAIAPQFNPVLAGETSA
jgi:sugar/nucleoside kinase (ribokinase family)